MKRIITYVKENKILILLIVVILQNIYLQMESATIKKTATKAARYASDAEDNAREAADNAEEAAKEAHRAYRNSFGQECYTCPE